MKRMRCTDTHPVKQKLDKLIDLANDLNLSIEIMSGNAVITDLETGNQYRLEDLDQPDHPMTGFPPVCEYQLIVMEKM